MTLIEKMIRAYWDNYWASEKLFMENAAKVMLDDMREWGIGKSGEALTLGEFLVLLSTYEKERFDD